jgi:hypothetical protein|tara:strand:- start:12007 stop:12153 length:147 start_codon:yes stop_codon:yes gene_type:complete
MAPKNVLDVDKFNPWELESDSGMRFTYVDVTARDTFLDESKETLDEAK